MKFSFDERGNVNTDFGVICFLNPHLEKKKDVKILIWETSNLNNNKTLAPFHFCLQDCSRIRKIQHWSYLPIETERNRNTNLYQKFSFRDHHYKL